MANKIVALPRAEAAAEKFILPEPDVSFEVDAESGDIRMIAVFRSVDPDVNKPSKKTIYLARTLTPVDVEFEHDGSRQVLAVGTQPLQVKVSLSYPMAAEEKKENPDGAGNGTSEDDEDDEVA